MKLSTWFFFFVSTVLDQVGMERISLHSFSRLQKPRYFSSGSSSPTPVILFVKVIHTEVRRWRARRRPPSESPLSTGSAIRHSTAILLPLLFSGYIELPSISSSLAADGRGYLVEQCAPCPCPSLAHGPPSSFRLLPVHPAHASLFFLSTTARTDPPPRCGSQVGAVSGCAWLR